MNPLMGAWEYGTLNDKNEVSFVFDPSVATPDVASLKQDQVLVEVISAAINPVDFKIPESDWLGRTFGMARGARPGLDFCGRVVAKHRSNEDLKQGDLVFGALRQASVYGTLGQYCVASTTELAPLPAGIDIDSAAALGTAAATAWQSLLPGTKCVNVGSKVLINGGSGGVGTFAIQFAKILGAEITATCSAANVGLCKQLGASTVLNYEEVDVDSKLREIGPSFDLAIDNVGTNLHSFCELFVKPSGTFVQVAANPSIPNMMAMAGKKLRSLVPGSSTPYFKFVMVKANHEDFVQFGNWLAEGQFVSVIDEKFELVDVPKAFQRLRGGRTKGKIIVHVTKDHISEG